MRAIRLGCGSAAAPDPPFGAVELLKRIKLDYLCFDTMAEISMPAQYAARLADADKGYDLLIEERLTPLLARAFADRVRLIGNFGGLNPAQATDKVVSIARGLGLKGLRVACVEGDDVLVHLRSAGAAESQVSALSELPGAVVGANAYLGAEPIVQALEDGADVVVAGRVADASMYLAPMIHEFGWAVDDWDRLGAGIALGHLAECGTFATGGAWSDPGYRTVPALATIGQPVLEVHDDGTATMLKAPGTGGVIHVDNLRAQLMHEIGDPTAYISPDVTANLTSVMFAQDDDQVRITWNGLTRGSARSDTLKVLVGVHEGYIGEAMLLVSGDNAVARARLIGELAEERLIKVLHLPVKDFRTDLIGWNSTLPDLAVADSAPCHEIMLRIAVLTDSEPTARHAAAFADYVSMIGPLGLGARRKQVYPCFSVHAAYLDRSLVTPTVNLMEVS